MTRLDVADYVGAVFAIYALIIITWVVCSLIFSLGATVPYSRPVNAVLDFLRDCTEPYLRLFRRLGLRVGPLDLSPMIAIIVLQVVGAIIVSVIRG